MCLALRVYCRMTVIVEMPLGSMFPLIPKYSLQIIVDLSQYSKFTYYLLQ